MKTKILIIFLYCVAICSCKKDELSISNCDQIPQWIGFDEQCGCYGVPIGFSKKCITSIKENDSPFFGYINYGHIKDSILIIYRELELKVSVITISDIPSLDSKGADLTWYLTNNKQMQLMYDETNWKNPNALGKATEARIDPKQFLAKPDQIKISIYQRESRSLASKILDSINVTLKKEIGRK